MRQPGAHCWENRTLRQKGLHLSLHDRFDVSLVFIPYCENVMVLHIILCLVRLINQRSASIAVLIFLITWLCLLSGDEDKTSHKSALGSHQVAVVDKYISILVSCHFFNWKTYLGGGEHLSGVPELSSDGGDLWGGCYSSWARCAPSPPSVSLALSSLSLWPSSSSSMLIMIT